MYFYHDQLKQYRKIYKQYARHVKIKKSRALSNIHWFLRIHDKSVLLQ